MESLVANAAPLDASVLQRLLTTKTFGRTLHLLTHTASTNDDAKALAQRGAPEGTVVLAEHQTQGRGRQGRRFASPAGVGIYLSLLLRPHLDAARLPQLTLLVAVATAEALTEASALPICLKWPNDVEIHGKKVAGILTEAVMHMDQPPAVIIGIGINVNTSLAQFPHALQQRVTSLALAAGHPWSRHQLIVGLLMHLERLYDTFQQAGVAPILERWLHYGCIVGRRVRWSQAQEETTGTVRGLATDGALLVQLADGRLQRVISGEVVFI
ncbi:MAG TPA: biotin--[acetyl-CoA-carboxylase] ligase [Candidatus Tectomicrobia bacterium]|jgi:BirA family biotin operon repressor/biotin-[acetyl-CoA-carboxylase] ligase